MICCSYERAPAIEVPVLVCHGSSDRTIPIAHGIAMKERFKHAVRPLYVADASHLSIFSTRHPVVFWRIRYF
ncbi:unnamed protein product, partial [Anisakis simplex]